MLCSQRRRRKSFTPLGLMIAFSFTLRQQPSVCGLMRLQAGTVNCLRGGPFGGSEQVLIRGNMDNERPFS